MLRALYEVLPAEQANDYMVDVIRRHPIGRVGQAREIADAILFLSTEESSFVGLVAGGSFGMGN